MTPVPPKVDKLGTKKPPKVPIVPASRRVDRAPRKQGETVPSPLDNGVRLYPGVVVCVHSPCLVLDLTRLYLVRMLIPTK